MPAYDPQNIFAKILRGDLPCYKIYEDDKALAFLDIMPRAPGHALVSPKASVRNILDVAPDDLAHVIKVVQKIAKVSVDVFGADGVTLQQFNESAAGQVAQAERLCRGILALDPRHADSLHMLGMIARQAGGLEDARDLMQKSLASNNRSADCHFNLAQVCRQLGRADEAIAHFTAAI